MKEKRKRKANDVFILDHWMPVAKLAIFGILAATVGVLFLAGLMSLWEEAYYTCFRTPFPSLQDVERYGYFEFPESANSIEYDAVIPNKLYNCTMWVWFEMDQDDFETFEASTFAKSITADTELDDTFELLRSRQHWEHIDYDLAGYGWRYLIKQWVFIDDTHLDRWKVYIITDVDTVD